MNYFNTFIIILLSYTLCIYSGTGSKYYLIGSRAYNSHHEMMEHVYVSCISQDMHDIVMRVPHQYRSVESFKEQISASIIRLIYNSMQKSSENELRLAKDNLRHNKATLYDFLCIYNQIQSSTKPILIEESFNESQKISHTELSNIESLIKDAGENAKWSSEKIHEEFLYTYKKIIQCLKQINVYKRILLEKSEKIVTQDNNKKIEEIIEQQKTINKDLQTKIHILEKELTDHAIEYRKARENLSYWQKLWLYIQ